MKKSTIDRTEQVNTRLSKQEKSIIRGRAAAAGKSYSDWAREVLLKACDVCPTCGKR